MVTQCLNLLVAQCLIVSRLLSIQKGGREAQGGAHFDKHNLLANAINFKLSSGEHIISTTLVLLSLVTDLLLGPLTSDVLSLPPSSTSSCCCLCCSFLRSACNCSFCSRALLTVDSAWRRRSDRRLFSSFRRSISYIGEQTDTQTDTQTDSDIVQWIRPSPPFWSPFAAVQLLLFLRSGAPTCAGLSDRLTRGVRKEERHRRGV